MVTGSAYCTSQDKGAIRGVFRGTVSRRTRLRIFKLAWKCAYYDVT